MIARICVTDCVGELRLMFENWSFAPTDPFWIAKASALPRAPNWIAPEGLSNETWWVNPSEAVEDLVTRGEIGWISIVRIGGVLEAGELYGHMSLWTLRITIQSLAPIARL
ncbi:MAG: hypothetical protein ACOYM8_13410 [Caulobacterales bacterium]